MVFKLSSPWQLYTLVEESKWSKYLKEEYLGIKNYEELKIKIKGKINTEEFIEVLSVYISGILSEIRCGQVYTSKYLRMFFSGSKKITLKEVKKKLNNPEFPERKNVYEEFGIKIDPYEIGEFKEKWFQTLPEAEVKISGLEKEQIKVYETLCARWKEFDYDSLLKVLINQYSSLGRKAIHPVLMLKLALIFFTKKFATQEEFLLKAWTNAEYQLFLGVTSRKQLPDARTFKEFLAERLYPYLELLIPLSIEQPAGEVSITIEQICSDGSYMRCQERKKKDAIDMNLEPFRQTVRKYIYQYSKGRINNKERCKLLGILKNLKELGEYFTTPFKRRTIWHIQKIFANELGYKDVPKPPYVKVTGRIKKYIADPLIDFVKTYYKEKFHFEIFYDPQAGVGIKYGKNEPGYGFHLYADAKDQKVIGAQVFKNNQNFVGQIKDKLFESLYISSIHLQYFSADSEFCYPHILEPLHYLNIETFISIREPYRKYYSSLDFQYDSTHNQYICPNNKILSFSNIGQKHYQPAHIYKANTINCTKCKLKDKCFNFKQYKQRIIKLTDSETLFENTIRKQWQNREKYKEITDKHWNVAEGKMNTLKQHRGIRKAIWKGFGMAKIQTFLAIWADNLRIKANGNQDYFDSS